MKFHVIRFFRNKSIGFLTLLIGCGVQAYAQNIFNFERITTEQGLSQSDVNSVYQDSKGFMWFATHDGLNKYDGYTFKVFKPNSSNSESINSNLIYSITGDKKGNLWVGTTGSGLNFFDTTRNQFTHFLHKENDKESISNNYIQTLYLDAKNHLWIGTINGLNMLNLNRKGNSTEFHRFYPEPNEHQISHKANAIHSIYEDDSGVLWVGTSQGLYMLVRDNNGVQYLKSMNDTVGLPEISVGYVGKDQHGRLLLGTSEGAYIQGYGNKGKKVVKFSEGYYNTMLVEQDGFLWMGTNEGLLYFENSTIRELPKLISAFKYESQNRFSISKNIIKSLYKDKTGILWIGTNGGGVNKYDVERKRFRHVQKNLNPNSLSYDKVRSMFEDSNDRLWIGTEGGGLNLLEVNTKDVSYDDFKILDGIKKPFALAEHFQKDKKFLYIGAETQPGLFHLDISSSKDIKSENIVIHPEIDRSVFSLLTDSDNNLWIGTYGGDYIGGFGRKIRIHLPKIYWCIIVLKPILFRIISFVIFKKIVQVIFGLERPTDCQNC